MTLEDVKIRAAALGVTIRPLPRWLPMAGITLGKAVFVRDAQNVPLVAHELVHVEQQARDGAALFYWRYATDAAWRVRYEAEAYMRAQVAAGSMTIDHAAQLLSGPLYLRPCSLEEARAALEAAIA